LSVFAFFVRRFTCIRPETAFRPSVLCYASPLHAAVPSNDEHLPAQVLRLCAERTHDGRAPKG
jgi:hypothetical protein